MAGGNYLVYVQREADQSSVWVRQIAANSTVNAVPFEPGVRVFGRTVEPDGTYIDYVRMTIDRRELWRVPFLGGQQQKVLDDVWSSASEHERGNSYSSHPERAGSRLCRREWSQHLGPTARWPTCAPLTRFSDRKAIANFDWSEDGRRLAVLRATTTSDVVLLKGLGR